MIRRLTVQLQGVNVFRSADGGHSWSSPVIGIPDIPGTYAILDKDWITVDNTTGPGQGTVYVAATQLNGAQYGIYVGTSTDGGATFTETEAVPVSLKADLQVQGADLVVTPDHALHLFYWQQNDITGANASIQEAVLSPGHKWGPSKTVVAQAVANTNDDLGLNGGFRTNTFPQAAVNPVNGDIYLVYGDVGKAAGDKADAYFIENSGHGWSSPLRLNDDTAANDQWFPALAVSPDGSHVGVSWYDRRLDPANSLIDRYGVIGSISGHVVSWGNNFRITTQSFPVVIGQDPVIASTYMGDYDTAAADNGFFYVSFASNQNADATHVHQPDVFLAKLTWSGLPLVVQPNVVLVDAILSQAEKMSRMRHAEIDLEEIGNA